MPVLRIKKRNVYADWYPDPTFHFDEDPDPTLNRVSNLDPTLISLVGLLSHYA